MLHSAQLNLGVGVDEFFLDEDDVRTHDVDVDHGVGGTDNEASKTKRMEWANSMWDNRDTTKI